MLAFAVMVTVNYGLTPCLQDPDDLLGIRLDESSAKEQSSAEHEPPAVRSYFTEPA